MKKCFRVAGGIMAALCALSLAACSGGGKESDTGSTDTSTSKDLAPFEETVTIKVLFMDDGVTTFPDGSSWDNNVWTQAYLDELNIKIESAGAIGAYEYNNKLSQMLSSQTLPDVFMVDSNMITTMVASDALADLTSLYDEYAGETAKKYYQYDNGVLFNSCKNDGKLYALPKLDVVYDSIDNVAIRTDWLDNLGLPEPTTWEDVLTIIEEFATKDPDGNGKNDTYGLAIDNMAGDGILKGVSDIAGFFSAYHADLGRWIEGEDGKLAYGTTQAAMKKPLGVLADFYAKGYIDPNYTEKDRWAVQADIKSGKVGVAFQGFWGAANWDTLSDTLGDKLKFYPIYSSDDQPVVQYLRSTATGSKMAVRKGFEHPEALFKMQNMELRHGTSTGEDWSKFYDTTDGHSRHKWAVMNSCSAPDAYITRYQDIQKVIKGEMEKSALPHSAKVDYERVEAFFNGEENSVNWGAYMNYGSKNSTFGVINHYLDNDMIKMELFTGPQTPTMMARATTLQWEEIGMFNAIVTGEQPVSYFDTWVSSWMQKGGEQVTKEVNEWYAANK